MPDDDETAVGHGPADETEMVAPATESDNSDGLAWSLADAQDYQTRGHWRDGLLWAGLVLLLCAVTAVALGTLGRYPDFDGDHPARAG